jgi:hypothetical protein
MNTQLHFYVAQAYTAELLRQAESGRIAAATDHRSTDRERRGAGSLPAYLARDTSGRLGVFRPMWAPTHRSGGASTPRMSGLTSLTCAREWSHAGSGRSLKVDDVRRVVGDSTRTACGRPRVR